MIIIPYSTVTAMQKAYSDGLMKAHLNERLLRAVNEGHGDLIAELVEQGADLSAVTASGQTALHLAASQGRTALVRLLVKCGALSNAQDHAGCTPLHHAAKHGYTGCGNALLEAGADRLIKNRDQYMPLHTALQAGNAHFLLILLSSHVGEQLGAKDEAGTSALHLAALCGHLNTFKTLYEKALIANPVTNACMTPLHCAASAGHFSLIPLIAPRAIVTARSLDGRTALHYGVASSSEDFTKTVAELIKIKVPLDDVDNSERRETALHSAARKGSFDQVELLLAAGATSDLLNALNETAEDLISASLLNHKQPTSDKKTDRALAHDQAQDLGYTSITSLFKDTISDDLQNKRKRPKLSRKKATRLELSE